MSATTTTAARARRALAAAAALVAAATAVGVWSSAAAAQSSPVEVSVVAVGWWTSTDAELDEGQFQVGAGPGGAETSVAAVQLSIDATAVASHELALVVDDAAFADTQGVVVCASAPFFPIQGGALEEAPEADCSTQVELTETDGAWIGDISPLTGEGGTVDLAVLPAYEPALGVGTGMEIVFGDVSNQAVGTAGSGTTTTTAATTTTTTTAAPPPTTAPDRSGGPVVAPPTTTTTAPLAGDLSNSNLAADPVPTSAPPTSAVSSEDDFFTLGPAEQFEDDPRPWWRLAILVPVSVALGVGSALVRRRLAAPAPQRGA